MIHDEGLGELRGTSEGGQGIRLRGRIAAVHKPLVSAARTMRNHVAFLNADGGHIFRADSREGRQLARIARDLAAANPSSVIPLHVERGVYNMYMELAPDTVLAPKPDAPEPVNPLTVGGSSSSSGGCRPAYRP